MNFLKTTKGLIITGLVLLVIVAIAAYNWSSIKFFFSSGTGTVTGRAKGGCVSFPSGYQNPVTGAWVDTTTYTYNGIAVSKGDCAEHGLL